MPSCPLCHGTFAVDGAHEVYRVCKCGETVQDKAGNWFHVGSVNQNYVGGVEAPFVDFAETCGGGTFIDVGANRGQWSLLLRDQFRRILCFEPDPVTFHPPQAVTRPYPHIT